MMTQEGVEEGAYELALGSLAGETSVPAAPSGAWLPPKVDSIAAGAGTSAEALEGGAVESWWSCNSENFSRSTP